jgi:SPX domain protein involved in polyphosphate accumulation
MNAGPDGYLIRSLYFDDIYESAFYDKLSGISERVKYRLRYYNGNIDLILFERKRKHDNFIEKDSLPVSRNTAELMLRNETLNSELLDFPLLAEYSALRSSRLLRPRVIVEYHRLAFVYPEQNVRITLDSEIRSGMHKTDTYFRASETIPVSNQSNVILEVKYDRYLPDRPKEALSNFASMPQSYSKFCMSILPMI